MRYYIAAIFGLGALAMFLYWLWLLHWSIALFIGCIIMVGYFSHDY